MKVHYKLVSEKAEDFSTELNKWIDRGYKLAGDLQVTSFHNTSLKKEIVLYCILLSIDTEPKITPPETLVEAGAVSEGTIKKTELVFLENGIKISEEEFNYKCKYQTITVGYPFKINNNWYLKYKR